VCRRPVTWVGAPFAVVITMEQRSFLIVGAGLYGAVCARVLTDAGHRCLVIDKRPHIAGNCFSQHEPDAGCHRHVYGPHIFHTDSERVWAFVTRFARFNHFVNRPRVRAGGRLYSFPINLLTLYQLFGVTTPAEAEAHLATVRIPCDDPGNFEQWCLSQVGREIYDTFIRGYTKKQWGRDPRELPASIIKRVPVRLSFDDNYYPDPWQGIPVDGYTALFTRLLADVEVRTSVDFLEVRGQWMNRFDHVVYTGAIDEFFDYADGVLEYRSLRFENEWIERRDFQGTACVNYTDEDVPYTRIVEHKHFDLDLSQPRTIVTREFSESWTPGRERFYPIGTSSNHGVHARYQERAAELRGRVTFGGRLGSYRYYDMDDAIAAALDTAAELVTLGFTARTPQPPLPFAA
jgi:UDP-galactopyranose mutase